MGPRTRIVALENRKISLPVPGIESQLLVFPVRRQVAILTARLRLRRLQQLQIIKVFSMPEPARSYPWLMVPPLFIF